MKFAGIPLFAVGALALVKRQNEGDQCGAADLPDCGEGLACVELFGGASACAVLAATTTAETTDAATTATEALTTATEALTTATAIDLTTATATEITTVVSSTTVVVTTATDITTETSINVTIDPNSLTATTSTDDSSSTGTVDPESLTTTVSGSTTFAETVISSTSTVVAIDPTNTNLPIYGTGPPIYSTGAPVYPVKTTAYETNFITYCPISSTKYENGHAVPTTYYGYSTITVTVSPSTSPAPSFPAKKTVYVTEYAQYQPVTTVTVINGKSMPLTSAVYKTVTVTVPAKSACPTKAIYTHPAAGNGGDNGASNNGGNKGDSNGNGANNGGNKGDDNGNGANKPAEYKPVQQIGDGQIQNPAKGADASPAHPAAYPAKNGTASANPGKPEVYNGAASSVQVGFGAMIIGAIAIAAL